MGWILGTIAAITGISFFYNMTHVPEPSEEEKKRREREKQRPNIPCSFSEGISQDQFENLVRMVTRRIRRVKKVTVKGPIVYCTVQAASGISEWYFKVDYNDYGRVTGQYWLSSDNDDSNIPKRVADDIKHAIETFPESLHGDSVQTKDPAEDTCCPFCGRKIKVKKASYCPFCGGVIEQARKEYFAVVDQMNFSQYDEY